MSEPAASKRGVAAWDLPTRLFHWTLGLCVLLAWVSYRYAERLGDADLVWHRANGLFILSLLVWRALWGVFGPARTRFTTFVRSPAEAWRYARGLSSGAAQRYLGHNPLGAYMIIALLVALAAQGAFGLFAVDENELTGGPLYRLVSEAANALATRWHARIFNYVLLPLIAIHVTANILYGVLKREPLIGAMVHGSKPSASFADEADVGGKRRGLGFALLLLAIAVVLVCAAIYVAGGKF